MESLVLVLKKRTKRGGFLDERGMFFPRCCDERIDVLDDPISFVGSFKLPTTSGPSKRR